MATPKVCVLRAPGTNCDYETVTAFERAGAVAERLHVGRLTESPETLLDYQILCVPGGFSFGDDVGAGVLFADQLRHSLGDVLKRFLDADTLSLGICNGFQVLLKAGVLPGGAAAFPPEGPRDVTLTWNTSGRYDARWVTLKTVNADNIFLRGVDSIEMPMAHAEGRLVLGGRADLAAMHAAGQVAVCYRRAGDAAAFTSDEAVLPPPVNPNGSVANIAGLSSPDGRVLGLMPHPERFIDATQHPQWTRLGLRGEGAGMALFRNAVGYFA